MSHMNGFRNGFALVALAAAAMMLTGCGGEDKPAPSGTESPAQPAAWILDEKPEGAVGVGDIKKSAKEGDEIILIGRIGGSAEPMSKSMAVFSIVDPTLPSCADKDNDQCPTPWDYCCEPRDLLLANIAGIQIVDEDGTPLKIDPQVKGLKPLDTVIVVGKVLKRPDEDTLNIAASGVYREEG